ncbi:DUF3086 domain-containing protein [Coleofasciculus sp. FACHB-1120]|uniref:DUF3086 domain-containing protein n=1 Tax=Coleofasciculus sp. FACHB-1120 TaxID=2692783 RepID=UPI0016879CE1|nr:DUF3086 domain-containing protein [Coleofasciculus sp. FACHB-1120]MBD2743149.1 DUF3086 domain-containing protein [Coleofasciculus sp. FACHB-1120]
MNSDEPQTQEQEQEQEQKQQPVVEASDNLEAPEEETVTADPASDNLVALQIAAVVEAFDDSEAEIAAVVEESENSEEPEELNVTLVSVVEESENSEEPEEPNVTLAVENSVSVLEQRVADLQQQEEALIQEIAALQASHNKILQDQMAQTQAALNRLVQESLNELEQRRQTLQISVEQLERRRERIREEMRRTFAGTSQELAIRVQGFKDYLVGSLQDLVVAAEELQLQKEPEPPKAVPVVEESKAASPVNPKFTEQSFQSTAKQIRSILDQYRTRPDYYGPPWQLRRTFEPVHAERVANWFFTQGGRGALRTMGSRLQNILISSSVISVLSTLYGDRVRALILANSPERLGEWRRGLQDCLGISRSDFGPEQGIVLFESSEAVVQKAERLVKERQMPLIIIDETEDQINLSLLQFPLWLAFAPDPQQMSADMRY